MNSSGNATRSAPSRAASARARARLVGIAGDVADGRIDLGNGNRQAVGRTCIHEITSIGASHKLGANPPLEGEGRDPGLEPGERGGVTFFGNKYTPPRRLAIARQATLPLQGRVRRGRACSNERFHCIEN